MTLCFDSEDIAFFFNSDWHCSITLHEISAKTIWIKLHCRGKKKRGGGLIYVLIYKWHITAALVLLWNLGWIKFFHVIWTWKWASCHTLAYPSFSLSLSLPCSLSSVRLINNVNLYWGNLSVFSIVFSRRLSRHDISPSTRQFLLDTCH